MTQPGTDGTWSTDEIRTIAAELETYEGKLDDIHNRIMQQERRDRQNSVRPTGLMHRSLVAVEGDRARQCGERLREVADRLDKELAKAAI